MYQWGWWSEHQRRQRIIHAWYSSILSRQDIPWDLMGSWCCLSCATNSLMKGCIRYKVGKRPVWITEYCSAQVALIFPAPTSTPKLFSPSFQLCSFAAFQIYFDQIRTPSMHQSGMGKPTYPLSYWATQHCNTPPCSPRPLLVSSVHNTLTSSPTPTSDVTHCVPICRSLGLPQLKLLSWTLICQEYCDRV